MKAIGATDNFQGANLNVPFFIDTEKRNSMDNGDAPEDGMGDTHSSTSCRR